MIRVILPLHLQTLAGCPREVQIAVKGTVSQSSILDALEQRYPMLRGTIRDHETLMRRPKVRFFVETQDVSNKDPQASLPDSIGEGQEPFRIVGAVAGG